MAKDMLVTTETLKTILPAISTNTPEIDKKIVDIDGKVTTLNEKVSTIDGKIVQGNWNQNNPNALDYIKNRVCYELYEPVDEVVPVGTYNFTYDSDVSLYTSHIGDRLWFSDSNDDKIDKAIVLWDDVEYICERKWEGDGSGRIDFFGNMSILEKWYDIPDGTFEDTGEPFLLQSSAAGGHCYAGTLDNNATHKISVYSAESVIHPLDSKFLPEDVAMDAIRYTSQTLTNEQKLQARNNIGAAALALTATQFTLTASGWSDYYPYTQTVTVNGVSADEMTQLIIPSPASSNSMLYYSCGTVCSGQGANQLVFTSEIKPSSDLLMYVMIQEVTV